MEFSFNAFKSQSKIICNKKNHFKYIKTCNSLIATCTMRVYIEANMKISNFHVYEQNTKRSVRF